MFIFFEKLRFQNFFRPHENEMRAFSNSSGLKSVFEKLRFRDGLVWTVGQFLRRSVDAALKERLPDVNALPFLELLLSSTTDLIKYKVTNCI